MKTIEELQEIIEQKISQLNYSMQPAELYEPMLYTLGSGGKRLRPVLTLMGCQLFSDEIEKACTQAIGLEMFHNFTLLHDDIMDKAFIRRSQPTVHIKWDVNRAILSGDALAIKSNILIATCDAAILPDVLHIFLHTALEVCEGQQYDLNFEIKDQVDEDEYLNMIKLKTAVLLAASLQIGALVGGADKVWAQKVYDFGFNMGMAFQLQDDYLDTFGDPEKFGKKIGGDILANKKTYLLIKAYQEASEQQEAELKKWFTGKDHDPDEKIQSVQKLFKSLHVDEHTRNRVVEYSEVALGILKEIPVKNERKAELEEFTRNLMHRVK